MLLLVIEYSYTSVFLLLLKLKIAVLLPPLSQVKDATCRPAALFRDKMEDGRPHLL